jgi:hypothetical protein
MVWTQGMHAWTSAISIEEVSNLVRERLPPEPPSPPPPRYPQPQSQDLRAESRDYIYDRIAQPSPSSHPWRRFFARQFDILVIALILGILIEVTAPNSVFSSIIQNNFGAQILSCVALVPVEVTFIGVFGTTIGKALYAIRIERNDAAPLNFSESFSRALSVYVRGLCLGIPLLSLFTAYSSYEELKKTGSTRWDKKLKCKVETGQLGAARITLLIVFWTVLLGLAAIGTLADKGLI